MCPFSLEVKHGFVSVVLASRVAHLQHGCMSSSLQAILAKQPGPCFVTLFKYTCSITTIEVYVHTWVCAAAGHHTAAPTIGVLPISCVASGMISCDGAPASTCCSTEAAALACSVLHGLRLLLTGGTTPLHSLIVPAACSRPAFCRRQQGCCIDSQGYSDGDFTTAHHLPVAAGPGRGDTVRKRPTQTLVK